MESSYVSTASSVATKANVSDGVAEAVFSFLEELARRVGQQQVMVVLSEQEPSIDEPEQRSQIEAIGGRLVFDYAGETGTAPSYTVEDLHMVGRVDETGRFTSHLAADGRIETVVLNTSEVIERDQPGYSLRLDPGVDVTPVTRLLVRAGDHLFSKDIDGLNHELPTALQGRLHHERFPLMELYVAYLDTGTQIFEPLPDVELTTEQETTSIEMVSDDSYRGMILDDEHYISSSVTDVSPAGLQTQWGSYDDEAVVTAVANGTVLPPLTAKQPATPTVREHHEGAVDGERTRLESNLPTDVYGETDE